MIKKINFQKGSHQPIFLYVRTGYKPILCLKCNVNHKKKNENFRPCVQVCVGTGNSIDPSLNLIWKYIIKVTVSLLFVFFSSRCDCKHVFVQVRCLSDRFRTCDIPNILCILYIQVKVIQVILFAYIRVIFLKSNYNYYTHNIIYYAIHKTRRGCV